MASNPRDDGAHAALGTLYEKLGRRDAALDSFDAALALCPEHPVARMGRGELRLRMGNLQGVEDVQRAALADAGGTHQRGAAGGGTAGGPARGGDLNGAAAGGAAGFAPGSARETQACLRCCSR